jgi:hypothetical protein
MERKEGGDVVRRRRRMERNKGEEGGWRGIRARKEGERQ